MSERPPIGLRQRKKELTRRAIADTAQALFRARGFDRVTVAEIAAAAEVSEGTVFNYFPTKEDLFWSGMDVFEARLVEAVAARPPGRTVLDAFREVVCDGVTAELASVIARDTRAGPHDAAPLAAAAAVMGAQRALVAFVHERVAAGDGGPRLAAAARAQARRVFALLDEGLGGYACRPGRAGRAMPTTTDPPA